MGQSPALNPLSSGDIAERKNIIAFGEVYSENVGDGIIFECMKAGLRSRGIDLVAGDLSLRSGYAPNAPLRSPGNVSVFRRAARYFVRRSLTLRRAITVGYWVAGGRNSFSKQFEDEIRKSDGIIIGGGQILVDRQLAFPLKILTLVKLAVRERKPIAIFSCGADRRQGMIAKRVLRRLVKSAAYTSVRDQASAEALGELGVAAEVKVRPDIGFLVGDLYGREPTAPKRTIGLNLMPYDTIAVFCEGVRRAPRADYVAFWRRMITAALERDWSVKLLTNGDKADAEFAEELYSSYKNNARVDLAPQPITPADLVSNLRGVDVLVASRMHAGIVGYSLGKPVVSMVWDRKALGVWHEADQNTKLVDFDEIATPGTEVEIIEYLLSQVDGAPGEDCSGRKNIAMKLSSSLDELAKCFASDVRAASA